MNILIWQKPVGIPNRWYFKDVEFTFYGFIGKAKTINNASSSQTFKCKHARDKVHVSQKPVELFEHYIENSTKKHEIVLEPFAGSGTTALACVAQERDYIAIEREQEYYEIAKARLEKVEEPLKLWEKFGG